MNSFLGLVWDQLPQGHPIRAQGQLLTRVIGRPPSVFHVDTATSLWALKAAMERGGFTRAGINTALETKIRGLPTPGGRLYFGPRNHSGIQMASMWAGRIVRASRGRCSARRSSNRHSARQRKRRRGPRLRGPRRHEVVRRRRSGRRRHAGRRARVADVPDRPERRRKSTLLGCISGLLRVDAGSIVVEGGRSRTGRLTAEPRRARRRVPDDEAARAPRRARQRDGRLPSVDARRVRRVDASRALAAPRGAAYRGGGLEALELVGLADRANVMAGSLPLGQLRLLAVARALAQRPRVLLLDEPAAGLRGAEKERLAEALLALKGAS